MTFRTPIEDKAVEYLRRADEARNLATFASSFVAMDELMDVAAAWRALALEYRRLATPVVKMVRPRTKNIQLVSPARKSDAA